MTVLVTGAAGFVGFHTAKRLLADGENVIGVDNFNSYYDPALKESRWALLESSCAFDGIRLDIADRDGIDAMFRSKQPKKVIHLAAQAGVRHGLDHPHDYANANLVGMLNILEGCRIVKTEHLVFASSSSVYGANGTMPFSEHDGTAHPVSLYAATKRANEAMAHAYAHLYQFPATGLRFFTVYGPWGRPDMASFKFTKAILAGDRIPVFNQGNMARDFTYVDDVVEGIVRALAHPPAPDSEWDARQADPATSGVAPYRLFNIGRGAPVKLLDFIAVLEGALGQKAKIDFQPMQPGDVEQTYCDVSELDRAVGYRPSVTIEDGVSAFVSWYREFYKV
jgi:UDP-glucuronate 4-epimerase